MAYVDSSARIVDFIAVINVESNYHPMAKRRSLSLFFGWQNTHTHPQLVLVVGMKEDLG
jgi:hypothetical protein